MRKVDAQLFLGDAVNQPINRCIWRRPRR